MRITNELLISQSAASSFNSQAFSLQHLYGFAVQAAITGAAPTGTLKLQASCDVSQKSDLSDVVNWTDVPTQTQAISATGTYLFNVDAVHYPYMRLVWVFTSGTGNISARINAKGV